VVLQVSQAREKLHLSQTFKSTARKIVAEQKAFTQAAEA
jgi:hypothetical protein